MDSLQKIYCRAFQGAFAVRFMTRWWRTLPLLILKKPGHCIWKAAQRRSLPFGGGSAMDCAKVTGACIVKPNKPIHKMKGLLRICKKLPLLIAVLTTAGTGSETTLAAVITDSGAKHKYPINDFSLIPRYAVLDYHVTLGLPKNITATTGMDALIHAVETYIGRSTTKETRFMQNRPPD